jgi:hypothetical protein
MSGKPTFRCWQPEDGGEEEDDVHEIEAWDAEEAAKDLAKQRRYDDYPERQRITVRAPDGTLTRWTVTAEPDVRFMARAEPA